MLNELLKSRHYRLKVFCLILIMYTMFEAQGLIWLTSLHLDFESEDHINFFGDEDLAGFGISCLFGIISVALFWWFSIRVILQYYYKEKDVKWMNVTKWIGKIATICWILSMLAWTLTILVARFDNWFDKAMLAVVPSWNKSLCIGLIYCIFYEFSPAISRTRRVVRWIAIVAIFLLLYVVAISLAVLFLIAILLIYGGVIVLALEMLFMSVILTPFYNFFFVLWDQLHPAFSFNFYMICVPCCCGCFCRDDWLRVCVPQCCIGQPRVKRATWLIVGMSFVWFTCTVFENYNECLAEAMLVEYAYGFRGAATLVLLLSVLINIELTYSGPVKNRHRNRANVNNNDADNIDAGGASALQPGAPLVVASNIQVVTNDNDEENDTQDADQEATAHDVTHDLDVR
mmetsp:Transcript_54518/g.87147  ORF Transcript_54518/g.87147 Transcript_54518/m.87147 type:complete len:401 (+) Transcript_54518:23-1225(+)